eukprot:PhM_4_TR10447/c0_g1_i4/m.96349
MQSETLSTLLSLQDAHFELFQRYANGQDMDEFEPLMRDVYEQFFNICNARFKAQLAHHGVTQDEFQRRWNDKDPTIRNDHVFRDLDSFKCEIADFDQFAEFMKTHADAEISGCMPYVESGATSEHEHDEVRDGVAPPSPTIHCGDVSTTTLQQQTDKQQQSVLSLSRLNLSVSSTTTAKGTADDMMKHLQTCTPVPPQSQGAGSSPRTLKTCQNVVESAVAAVDSSEDEQVHSQSSTQQANEKEILIFWDTENVHPDGENTNDSVNLLRSFIIKENIGNPLRMSVEAFFCPFSQLTLSPKQMWGLRQASVTMVACCEAKKEEVDRQMERRIRREALRTTPERSTFVVISGDCDFNSVIEDVAQFGYDVHLLTPQRRSTVYEGSGIKVHHNFTFSEKKKKQEVVPPLPIERLQHPGETDRRLVPAPRRAAAPPKDKPTTTAPIPRDLSAPVPCVVTPTERADAPEDSVNVDAEPCTIQFLIGPVYGPAWAHETTNTSEQAHSFCGWRLCHVMKRTPRCIVPLVHPTTGEVLEDYIRLVTVVITSPETLLTDVVTELTASRDTALSSVVAKVLVGQDLVNEKKIKNKSKTHKIDLMYAWRTLHMAPEAVMGHVRELRRKKPLSKERSKSSSQKQQEQPPANKQSLDHASNGALEPQPHSTVPPLPPPTTTLTSTTEEVSCSCSVQ